MSTSTPFPIKTDGDPSTISPRRFSVAEYHKLAEVGVLREDDRVELIDGVISSKMVHSPVHDAIVSWIEQQLRPHLLDGWFLRIQSTITLDDASEPEPDLAVVRGTPLTYLQQHPQGSSVALVIEVAETSLGRDRYKATAYARAGIPAYWIVNLKQRRIEAFRGPDGAEYRESNLLGLEDGLAVELGFADETRFNVADLIPTVG
ncbi:Uma2 family endonuclease [Novipirellula artificiosorum]|uniref:Putative restriction endonuclease domain-containing protein n=1 Tax=Novipirellula artificiosorum TaxID=2528016 RepID=A0A5C6D729_9BACT|nr:Uma2 family endonuclease [Novipirellula artificiosorum]TWU32620.1 hypothetical protein Poly41_55980 [Novipirellula artificiosorum]